MSDLDWVWDATSFEWPEPLRRLAGSWERMTRSKGALRHYELLGTVPGRGGFLQTLVAFDRERNREVWLLLWLDGKLAGWDIDMKGPAPVRFLPTGPGAFALLDVAIGRLTRLRFDGPGRLVVPVAMGEVTAPTRGVIPV